MSVTKTVEIPDNRRLTIDIPIEVPAGPVILTFTPIETSGEALGQTAPIKERFRMAEDFDEPPTLITHDENIARYAVPQIW